MKRPPKVLLASSLAGLFVGAGLVGLMWTLSSGDEREPKAAGQVKVSFEPGPPQAVELIERSGLFERVAETVSSEIALPSDLEVRVAADDAAAEVGPTYVPRERAIIFPWSFVVRSHRDLARATRQPGAGHKRIDAMVAGAMAFVLYHELAHGIFDMLDTPILGSEERTADSLAAVLGLLDERAGKSQVLSAASLELAQAELGGEPSVADYADDHGFSRQRAFDALCAVYGSDPDDNEELLHGPDALPAGRAELCEYDYQAQLRGWRRLLRPHLTHTGGLLPLAD